MDYSKHKRRQMLLELLGSETGLSAQIHLTEYLVDLREALVCSKERLIIGFGKGTQHMLTCKQLPLPLSYSARSCDFDGRSLRGESKLLPHKPNVCYLTQRYRLSNKQNLGSNATQSK